MFDILISSTGGQTCSKGHNRCTANLDQASGLQ